MGLFGSTTHDARPAHRDYGRDYSRYFLPGPDPADVFPNPINEAQRLSNARARAHAAGDPINSGYLNPKTHILEDPDRGFGRWMGNHPGVMAAGVIGGGLTAGALMGPAAGPTMPAVGNVNATVDALMAGGGAGGGGGSVAGAGGLWGTGLTYKDLISGGADVFDRIYSTNAARAAAQTNDRYLREALDFAKQQYADQTQREQARWDATEARRVPYRQASQDTLAEFRKLLGDLTMAIQFDVRGHRFFETDDPPRPRTPETMPRSATEQAQFRARRLRGEPDDGTRGYTLPLSFLVSAPPRRAGKA